MIVVGTHVPKTGIPPTTTTIIISVSFLFMVLFLWSSFSFNFRSRLLKEFINEIWKSCWVEFNYQLINLSYSLYLRRIRDKHVDIITEYYRLSWFINKFYKAVYISSKFKVSNRNTLRPRTMRVFNVL